MCRLPISWPEGKRFAFTVFDEPDAQSLEDSRRVYGFLRDLGLRTTKGVWPVGPERLERGTSETCGNPLYREHVRELQEQGFEIGFHLASLCSSPRCVTEKALEDFKNYFGKYPAAMSNHFGNTAQALAGDGADLVISNQMHAEMQAAFRQAGFCRGPSNYQLGMSPPLTERVRAGGGEDAIHLTRGDGDGRMHL